MRIPSFRPAAVPRPGAAAHLLAPFGYWPAAASTIAGLGGAETAPTPGYAFHSRYEPLPAGRIAITLAFADLRASRGTLTLRVQAEPFDGTTIRTVRTVRLPLARLAREGGRAIVRFTAGRDRFHAVYGQVSGDADARAAGLALSVDPPPLDPANRPAMLAARTAVFARPSLVERRWGRRSPVDRLGLVSTAPGSIAHPASQLCTERQLDEPAYAAWLAALGQPNHRHRKQWEAVYALAVLEAHGMIAPGKRGVSFGCGTEWLPAHLAGRGCAVLATDMPADHRDAAAWAGAGQFAHARDALFFPEHVDRAAFDRLVGYRSVDMNAVPADLSGFDFSWSLCAFEHLGSIERGLAFIHAAVACLKPGGVAVHTTEFNLVSDDHTIDHAPTVLFRRRDMERLALSLTRAGHRVLPLRFDPGDDWRDDHVDVPPYGDSPHLKLALRQYVTTSFGIAVVRGV